MMLDIGSGISAHYAAEDMATMIQASQDRLARKAQWILGRIDVLWEELNLPRRLPLSPQEGEPGSPLLELPIKFGFGSSNVLRLSVESSLTQAQSAGLEERLNRAIEEMPDALDIQPQEQGANDASHFLRIEPLGTVVNRNAVAQVEMDLGKMADALLVVCAKSARSGLGKRVVYPTGGWARLFAGPPKMVHIEFAERLLAFVVDVRVRSRAKGGAQVEYVEHLQDALRETMGQWEPRLREEIQASPELFPPLARSLVSGPYFGEVASSSYVSLDLAESIRSEVDRLYGRMEEAITEVSHQEAVNEAQPLLSTWGELGGTPVYVAGSHQGEVSLTLGAWVKKGGGNANSSGAKRRLGKIMAEVVSA
jgi:hypothetical protein